MKTNLIGVLSALLLSSVCTPLWANPTASSKKSFVFGVVPQQSATQLAKNWVPLLKYLSQEIGHDIRFATAKDIPTFEACLSLGAYDLAYMNPYHYTIFHAVSGYRAFARQADKKLRGLIVVRRESTIQNLVDLDNQKIAFPSPAAFGASVIPRAEMVKQKIHFIPSYVKSHDSVYRAVVAGLFPAGGGVLRTFGNISDDIRSKLRILYKTNAYTPHAFAAHPKFAPRIIQELTAAMLTISKKQPELLQALGMAGFQAATDSDWNDVRSLNLSKDQTEIVIDDQLKCHSG